MDKKALTILIQKFLADKCTPAEKLMLKQWWENALMDDAFMKALSPVEQDVIKNAMFKNIRHLIQAKDNSHKTDNTAHMGSRTISPKWYGAIAATIVMLGIIAFVAVYIIKQYSPINISTAYGERLEILLPDSSKVVLNGNSSLKYDHWKKDQIRKVWLEGEAFFSVKHTKNHNRFIVFTPDSLKVEVLGTQFSVNNRKGTTRVILREGEVKLHNVNDSYIMKPNEMVSYSKDKPVFIMENVNAQQEVAWKDNLLIYRDETVGSIIEKLSETHGLKVTFKNKAIKDELFNGSIPGDSVDVFFDKIDKLYNINLIRKENGHYIIE